MSESTTRRGAPSVLLSLALAVGCAGPDPSDKNDSPRPDSAEAGDTGDSGIATPPDRDGDGWPDAEDCAPDDPATNPGATESCNGADDDCDGEVDEAGASGETAWHGDGDGDGYGAGEATDACDAPLGTVADATDCDDADPAVNPGASETCGNGIDDDCDGGGEECRYEGYADLGDVAAFSEEPHARDAGVALGGGCDLDGDGLPEAIVGVPSYHYSEYEYRGAGVAYVLRGGDPVPATLDGAWARVTRAGAPDDDGLGVALACGDDADGDGVNSLLVGGMVASGESDETVVHLLALVAAGEQGTSDAIATVTGDSTSPTVRAGGDTTGDGTGEFFVQVKLGDSSGYEYGLRGFSLGLTGDVTFDDASVSLDYPENVGPYSFDLAGDYDGDGLADLVTGVNDGSDGCDCLYVFPGPLAGSISLEDASTVLDTTGDESSSSLTAFQVANLGDFDGDGRDDLVVGHYTASSVDTAAGSVYVAPGPLPAAGSVADLPTRFTGLAYPDAVGRCVAGPGDLDGDGNNDLLATASNYGDSVTSAPGRGAVHVVYGPASGIQAIVDAGPTLYGSADREYTGRDCTSVGDFNGDGLPDFALTRLGAWDYSVNRTEVTAGAWIVPGVAW